MSPRIPIGEPEGQRLELKPRAALKRPEAIVRAVVGMLNAEGGEVWIGVRSEAGVAVELEGVGDAERARRRLQEALIDRIEPTPGLDEARVEVVRPGRDLLRVEVRPIDSHRPYAASLGPGREYPVRMAAVSRNLSREEIRALFAGAPTQAEEGREETSTAARRLAGEQRRVLDTGEAVLWIGATADLAGAELDLAAVQESDLLTESRRAGGLDLVGWPEALRGALLAGELTVETWWVAGSGLLLWKTRAGEEIRLDPLGGLGAVAPLARFAAGNELVGYPAALLSPDRLVGRIVSAFRVLAGLYSAQGLWRGSPPLGTEPAWVSMVAAGLAGWSLPPGHLPREQLRPRRAKPVRVAHTEFALDSALPLTVAVIRDEPDRCAFRLLARFYESFGFSESDVPYFDPRTERFDWSLPEPL